MEKPMKVRWMSLVLFMEIPTRLKLAGSPREIDTLKQWYQLDSVAPADHRLDGGGILHMEGSSIK